MSTDGLHKLTALDHGLWLNAKERTLAERSRELEACPSSLTSFSPSTASAEIRRNLMKYRETALE